MQIYIASETRQFHQLVREYVTSSDYFLEFGCSFGECTKILMERGCRGVAVDHAEAAVAKTQQITADYPDIVVIQADVRDIDHIIELCPHPSVILLDIGGNEPLPKTTSILRLILKSFRPRLIIVKSMELAELSLLVQGYQLPNVPHLLAPIDNPLIELSYSPVTNDRLFALKRMRHMLEEQGVRERITEMCQDENQTVRKRAEAVLKTRRD